MIIEKKILKWTVFKAEVKMGGHNESGFLVPESSTHMTVSFGKYFNQK